MKRNDSIKVLITPEEKSIILRNAKMRGYGTMGGFIRDLALNYNFNLEQKIIQIHTKVGKISEFIEDNEDLKTKAKKRTNKLHKINSDKYNWMNMFELNQ